MPDTGNVNHDLQSVDSFLDSISQIELTEQDSDVDISQAEVNVANLTLDDDEPNSYQEAIASYNPKEWKIAMRGEYDSLIRNKTWKLEEAPREARLIKCKWVYKLKRNLDGSIFRYKARLVAKGFPQRYGIDCQETCSSVVRIESIRMISAIVARDDLELIQFDVKTAFLYGNLEEDIWMQRPEGFIQGERLAYHLQKSFYDLKQAVLKTIKAVWNECFVNSLKKFQLTQLGTDNCVLVRSTNEDLMIVAIYVDDGLICGKDKDLMNEIVSYLKQRFDITLTKA